MPRTAQRVISEAQINLIRDALNEVTGLAVLYERRLIVKGRYQGKAHLAALKVRGAKSILRSLPAATERTPE